MDKPPTRACFAVKRLPRGALCEIECIALKDGSSSRETIPGNKLFSKAVITDDLVFVAGQLALDPSSGTKELVSKGDPAGEARQALKNIVTVLHEAGAKPKHITRMTWYLIDLDEYNSSLRQLGQVYHEVIGKVFPAMTGVQVAGLVEKDAKLEIEVTAVIPD